MPQAPLDGLRKAGPGPSIRAATWGERMGTKAQDVYESLAQQPLSRITDMLGMTDIQGVVDNASDPNQVLGAVAAGGPGAIAGLKAGGKALLAKIKKEGLRQSPAQGRFNAFTGEALEQRLPTRPPKELINALTFAQEKYPRLFGHLTSITDINRSMVAPNRMTLGSSSNVNIPKRSNLRLNPDSAAAARKSYPETVGHELLHTADRITRPDMDQLYAFANTLPGGYATNSAEYRARNAGESFNKKYAAWAAAKQPLARVKRAISGLMGY